MNESEAVVLGTIIYNNDMYLDISDTLTEDDFYSTANKLLFTTISKLYRNNNKFDRFVIQNKLDEEIKQGIITKSYITELLTHSDPFTFKTHIKLVKEESNKRKINELLKVIQTKKTADEMLKSIEDTIYKIKTDNTKDEVISLEQAFDDTLSNLEEVYANNGKITGLKTNIEYIDEYLNGFQKKEFNVFAARPSCGKTAFSLELVKSIDAKVLYIQLDMGIDAVIRRMIASGLNIPCGKVSRARLSDKEWQEVTKYYAYMIKNKKIDFYQPKRPTVTTIRNKARELKLKQGLDVIIIDHIGKIVPEMKGSRYEQMTLISNELKRLAIELDVNVTVLCQLSRAVEQRSDKRPMLSDLRDSGAIEEDADNIGMLYRDGYYRARETGEEVTEDILEIDFQKVRNGRLAKVEFQYNLETQRLTQLLN